MRKYLIPLILTWTLAVSSQPYCNVRRFSLRDGLASNVVSSIEQTKDQLMWFSSWNGLNCYDGYTFMTFNDHSGTMRTLTTNRLLKITPSASDNIWCLTYDRQVFLFKRSSGRFVNFTALVNQVSGQPFVCQRIACLDNGYTWLFNREAGGPCFRINEQQGETTEAIEMFSRDNGLLKGGSVYGVELDGEGREWLMTDGGTTLIGQQLTDTVPYTYMKQAGKLVILATKDGRIGCYDGKKLKPLGGMPAGISTCSGLHLAGDNKIVAQTNAGLLVYNANSHTTKLIATGATADVQESYIDSRQRVWAFTSSGEVLLTTLSNGQTLRMPTVGLLTGLPQCTRYLIHEDPYGTIWVGTGQGFFGYYDEQTRRLTARTIRTNSAQPTLDRWFVDRRGDLWFSGEHDVAVVNFSRRLLRQTVLDQLQQVRSVCYDSQGRLWTGDIAGHVAVSDSSGRVTGYLGTDGRLHPQPVKLSHHVYCLHEDSQGRMWIGTKGDGLFCTNGNGTLTHYRHDEADGYSLPSNQIYDVYEDGQHRIWVGTFEQGICLLQEGRFLHAGNQLKGYPVSDFFKVRRITGTADGSVIVAASNGLVTFSERFTDPSKLVFHAHKHVEGDTTSLLTSDVMQACTDRQGRIFVATVGGGLQEVAEPGGLLKEPLRLKSVAGSTDGDYGTVLSMTEDNTGNLWIGRESSLAMREATTGRLWLFGPAHLGEHTELTEAKPAYNPKTGQIAFATTDGYIILQPALIGREQFEPPLVFLTAYFHSTGQTVNLTADAALDVPVGQRGLTIHFAALDYQDNFMIRYAYQLEGTNEGWNELGPSEHSISFGNLPHGRHRLLVRCTNQYGAWTDLEGQALTLNVEPTFWETPWAKLLYVLLIAALVAVTLWIYRLKVHAAQERQQNRMLSLLLEEMKTRPQPLPTGSGEETSSVENAGTEDHCPPPQDERQEAEPEANVLHLQPTTIVDSDKQLMEQLLAYIEGNLANPDLRIEDLAQAVCLGRTVFYNKVKALVGMSPVELLRHIRIRHAEEMVAKSQEPFSQIAYAVGFSDAHYFGKCFKKQTGLTPSEYRERKA